jgi:AcrR family transcriptional regulator
MARNTHPEKTRRRILDVAKQLFFTKGYDHTTMQDIVNGLDGMSKGAIYYHFKSKEAILDALGEEDNLRMETGGPRSDPSLNGLQKLRATLKQYTGDTEHMTLMREAFPLLKNPKVLASNLEAWRTVVADSFERIIDQGIEDGSIVTQYPREAAEILSLLSNYWLAPDIYPATRSQLHHRVECLATICASLGVPIFDDESIEIITHGYEILGGLTDVGSAQSTDTPSDDTPSDDTPSTGMPSTNAPSTSMPGHLA